MLPSTKARPQRGRSSRFAGPEHPAGDPGRRGGHRGLSTVCWREAYAGLVADDYLYADGVERRRLDRWRERLAGSREVWLAEADGQVVGVASLWVFAANRRAHRFYTRHGFVVDGTEKIDPDTGMAEIRMVRL